MSEALNRLAAMVGIEGQYRTLTGSTVEVSDAAKRKVLAAMGIATGSDEEIARSIATLRPVPLGEMSAPAGVRCYVPDWLQDGRSWGIGCQLYALRSQRNWGIGDFEDLGRLAEIAAAAGADFVGINPLHALFLAAPDRSSPFSPSTRQFLNPLYIAVDKAPGCAGMEDALQAPADIRDSELVDYPRVAALKLKALDRLFRIFEANGSRTDRADFQRFVVDGGQPLYLHALFETLSEAMVEQGHPPTWQGWPERYRHPATDAVRSFAAEKRERIAFFTWLQWLADRQLAGAQQRARQAELRIGLYLDLAVGVSPDGSATWADRDLVVPAARIGAPPDYFNAAGQDWGLAPFSPAALVKSDYGPYRRSLDAVLRHAGAIRIDHAMSLYRLFWIAEGLTAADGVYVRYPFHDMLRTLAEVSQARGSIVIGEDLGVVPSGFRDVMQATEIQSYRVFFFERQDDFYLSPLTYPKEALACITTHDLYTLAGWWNGHNIEIRRRIGMLSDVEAEEHLVVHSHDRRRLLGLLSDHGLLPPALTSAMRGEVEAPRDLPDELAVALHRLVARAPSRLVVVQTEDLTGATDQVNVPGTVGEHPNWQRKLSVDIETLADLPLFKAITAALREERPKPR